MLTYANRKERSATLRSLTRLTARQFEQLDEEVAASYAAAEERRRFRPNRQRRRGAGHQFRLGLQDRLLLALVWLRVYPLTDEPKAQNRVLAKAGIRIEPTISQVKVYQGLAQVYRHRRGRYHDGFWIVAALTNRRRAFGCSVAC
jgi:hypothetical protein